MRYDLRDLLPVGSDVLYGRAPDRSRNTAETLDSSKVAFDAALNQRPDTSTYVCWSSMFMNTLPLVLET